MIVKIQLWSKATMLPKSPYEHSNFSNAAAELAFLNGTQPSSFMTTIHNSLKPSFLPSKVRFLLTSVAAAVVALDPAEEESSYFAMEENYGKPELKPLLDYIPSTIQYYSHVFIRHPFPCIHVVHPV